MFGKQALLFSLFSLFFFAVKAAVRKRLLMGICNDLKIVYPFVMDEYRCQDLREACCNEADSDSEWGLCAPGGYLETPELQVPFFTSATYASIDSDLSFSPANSCSDDRKLGFDASKYCRINPGIVGSPTSELLTLFKVLENET